LKTAKRGKAIKNALAENKRFITVKGANLNNLKDVEVKIPRNKLTVVTGVSGSGKSSLAFDTVYAEGQRRFVESLSSYARQFLERKSRPDVESISGLPPAIAIEQLSAPRNPRSTVGTTTEIYDYVRLLFGRIGRTICKISGRYVQKDSPETIVKELLQVLANQRIYILFSPDLTAKASEEIDKFKTNGYFRIVFKDSNEILDLNNDFEKIPQNIKLDDFYFLADRLAINNDPDSLSRLTESIEAAFFAGNGRLTIKNIDTGEFRNYSNIFEDAESGRVYVEPEPRLFSFNNPFGACPSCQGSGKTVGIDKSLVIPDLSLSLERGAIAPFKGEFTSMYHSDLIFAARMNNIPTDVPVAQLEDRHIQMIWEGFDDFIGINPFFIKLEEKNYKIQNRVTLAKFRGFTHCNACGGSRLRTSARQVYIGDMNVPKLVELSLDEFLKWLENIKVNERELAIVGQVLKELIRRTKLLVEIGLGYLTLDRLTQTLSGGEYQRINLATAIGSSLVGALYILDEPSVGLHPTDNEKLIQTLFKLRDLGNTVVVVEHDPEIILSADYIIEMGPFAGEFGGEVVFSGTPKQLLDSSDSLTAKYLTNNKVIALNSTKRISKNTEYISIFNAKENNLRIDKVDIPTRAITVISGVSGSGKSTLAKDILFSGFKRSKGNFSVGASKYERIEGLEDFDDIVLIDQASITKSSRSTPITYIKGFDDIRELFANTQHSRQLGWTSVYYSFNVGDGKCDVCQGDGEIIIDMQFLPNVSLKCESCKGTRYKKEILDIKFKEKSIVDVLNMTAEEARVFFDDKTKISNSLDKLINVGLGYLKLGQSTVTLSGGEAQRLKLATSLDESRANSKVYIFDEPTTGLHLHDIAKVLESINRLVEQGSTVIIIEHNLHVLAIADWIIDLGPGPGFEGGKVVAKGTPKHIATTNFPTGLALNTFFQNKGV